MPRRPRYADVTATAALFIALGGTAVAADTLPAGSVGSREIAADAVRSPEIRSGAVRSSEIQDGGIRFGDLSPAARPDLLGEVRVAEVDGQLVEARTCLGDDMSACPDFLRLRLSDTDGLRTGSPAPPVPMATPGPQVPEPGRNWLVQAKFAVSVGGPTRTLQDACGLVDTSKSGAAAVLDQISIATKDASEEETIALSGVVRKAARNPTVALRCTEQVDDRVELSFTRITAVEVGEVTGP